MLEEEKKFKNVGKSEIALTLTLKLLDKGTIQELQGRVTAKDAAKKVAEIYSIIFDGISNKI